MRQRKAKDLNSRLAACSDYLRVPVRESKTGVSSEKLPEMCFGKDLPRDLGVYAEIGCGKGQFLISKAIKNPDCRFIGIEGQGTVILRAAERAIDLRDQGRCPLKNIMFVNCFVNNMEELFGENCLSGIYLNFSDPWPKPRHAKRRLTYHERLIDYAYAICPGGFIEIKTDNDDLFEFTLNEIDQVSHLNICEMTSDLHIEGGTYDARFVTTEYEDKFKKDGKSINYVKVTVEK